MLHTTNSERAKYDRVWRYPEYRLACHSLRLWKERQDLFPSGFSSALDIGCGLGLLIDEWNSAGIDAWGVDISRNCVDHSKVKYACLWEMSWPRRFEFGICTDVMEHIPICYVLDTLQRIAGCCDEILFKIAHEPNELDGKVLHLTLHPAGWWVDRMNEVGQADTAEFLGTQERSGCQDSLIKWPIC